MNKGDAHNCRLYVKIEIETGVCVQVVRMKRCSCGFPLFLVAGKLVFNHLYNVVEVECYRIDFIIQRHSYSLGDVV